MTLAAPKVASLPEAAKAVVRKITYPTAGQAWDRREPDVVINEPTAHKGAGWGCRFGRMRG